MRRVRVRWNVRVREHPVLCPRSFELRRRVEWSRRRPRPVAVRRSSPGAWPRRALRPPRLAAGGPVTEGPRDGREPSRALAAGRRPPVPGP